MKPRMLLFSLLLSLLVIAPVRAAEEFVEYIPKAGQTEIHIWTSGNTTFARVKITFADCSYRVTDWGTVQQNGNDFSVDIKAERWTGFSCQAVTVRQQTYTLGTLAPGQYSFTVRSRGTVVKSESFDPVAVVEHWEPFIPAPDTTVIAIRTNGGVTFAFPSISCGDQPCRAEWGPVTRSGNDFAIDVKLERWTGQPTSFNGVTQTYSLGPTPPGSYSFSVYSRGILVRRQPFNTPGENSQYYGNPIDDPPFFIRQHYLDFLNREPEQAGYQAWQDILRNCTNGSTLCDRIEVSSAFFRSAEFQERGYLVYRFYSAAFGRFPHYTEFMADLSRVSGFLSDEQREANKREFVAEFMSRPEFRNRYEQLTDPTAYVNTLVNTAGVILPTKDGLITELEAGRMTRGQVLRAIAESAEVYRKFYNEAFVVMQYFGYLRRDPDALYQNWIQTLNSTGDYHLMVNGFVNSVEYRHRFGQ